MFKPIDIHSMRQECSIVSPSQKTDSTQGVSVNQLPFPIFFLDFEASSVGPQSYPIEAGLGFWRGSGHPIITWSTLIQPAPDWTDWSEASAKIHDIPRAELATGRTVESVARRLNEMMIDRVAYSDAPALEARWTRRLYAAAGVEQTWAIGDIDDLLGGLDNFAIERRARWLERTKKPHRAGPDIEREVKGLARAINARDVAVVRQAL